MKGPTTLLLAAATTASAHYTFPALVADGTVTDAWQYVRKTANYQSMRPVTDVTSPQLRCYELSPGTPAPGTYTLPAGSTLGFTAHTSISHPGPLQFYMARVPAGQTAASFDGAGPVWFKLFEQGPVLSAAGGPLVWPAQGNTTVEVTLPRSLPSGEYLLRVEHIALHSAGKEGGAQFYVGCAQVRVTGGGDGVPGPLVAFPGAYEASDPGLAVNIYYPVPTAYMPPGPRPWTG